MVLKIAHFDLTIMNIEIVVTKQKLSILIGIMCWISLKFQKQSSGGIL